KVPFTYIDQSKKETVSSTSTNHEIPYTYVDHMPEFPGGTDALMNFLGENIIYPDVALQKDIQGTVVLRYIVNTDGKISDIQVVRKVGEGLDEEAVRVVKKMPAWIPGSQNGENVRVYFVLPIKFILKSR
ncbi:MAG: energy transducer TonB, partial [Bacteroidota bacterium]|nr:energy transducer TonB [Bacteroidota bacterium]